MELNKKKIILTYLLICLGLVLLSFLSLLFKEWVLPLCVLICTVFGFINLLLLIKTHQSITPEGGKGVMVTYMLLRYGCMIVGLVLSCLLVRFTMGEVITKTRYLFVIIGAIPYFVVAIPWMIIKN